MNWLNPFISLLVGVAGLAFLAWLASFSQTSTDEAKICFRAESSYPKSQVQDCLFTGKGGEVFDGLHYMPVRMGGSHETYVDAGRKRLVLDVSDNHTRVAFSSDVPATFAELDILSWCVNNPDLTWIPRELR